MDGENLCFSDMEVAFEQWTEQDSLSRLQRFFHRYQENNISNETLLYCMRAKKVFFEFRW